MTIFSKDTETLNYYKEKTMMECLKEENIKEKAFWLLQMAISTKGIFHKENMTVKVNLFGKTRLQQQEHTKWV